MRRDDLSAETNMGRDLETPRAAVEVRTNLIRQREVAAPGMIRGKRVTVAMPGDIHPAPRIAVLEPGSTHARVLLNNRVGDSGLCQAYTRKHSSHTSANHDHRELRRPRLELRIIELQTAPVNTVERHLFIDKLEVFRIDVRAAHEAVEGLNGVSGKRFERTTTRLPVGNRRQCPVVYLRHLSRCVAALQQILTALGAGRHHVQRARCRQFVQQCRVTRHMHH